MTLSALIRKRDTGSLATAIPAISATQPKGEAGTVARIATVAVANPKKVGANDTATASPWRLIYYPDRDPARAARFRRALALLAETPGRQVALVTDLDAEPGFVLVTLAF